MKICTDINQSRKLAKFLSIESADMYRVFENNAETRVYIGKIPNSHFVCEPCWSLAALLDVLPLEVETHKQTDGHKIYYYAESYMKRNGKEIYQSTERHENLIDATYEMIIKLHELNLL